MKYTTISAQSESAGAAWSRARGEAADLPAGPRSRAGGAEKPAPQANSYPPGMISVASRSDLAAVRAQAEEIERTMSGGNGLKSLVDAIAAQIASTHSYAMRLHAGDPAKVLAAFERG